MNFIFKLFVLSWVANSAFAVDKQQNVGQVVDIKAKNVVLIRVNENNFMREFYEQT